MKLLKLIFAIGAISLLCQSCASHSSSENKQQPSGNLIDLSNGVCQQSNGLMWQTGNKEVFSNSQKALEYVQALHIGNYNDWRLPSKEELYNLYQIYEMKLSGNCPIKLKGSYWLTDGDIHAGEWEAYPICGGSELQYFNATDGRIMAVRP